MKKIITLVWVLCALPFYAQHKVADNVEALVSSNTAFSRFSPLSIDKNAKPKTTVVENATYTTINSEIVKQIADAKPENIEVNIPYDGGVLTVQLYRVDIFKPNFHVDTSEGKNVYYEKGAHYRGILKDDRNSLATFNFFKEEMNGMISTLKLGNLVVDKLRKENNLSEYIVYSDKLLKIKNPFSCGVADTEAVTPKNGNGVNGTLANQQYAVGIYFELDNDLFKQNNSNFNQTSNWITSVFNNMQTLYSNDGINVALSSFFIWQQVDYYATYLTSDANLSNFYIKGFMDGDLNQLVAIDPGGLGGLAYLRGLCGKYASYCDVDLAFQDVPVYSWTVEAMTHEIGHQLGSPHTHACAWNGNNTPIDVCGSQAGYSEGCDEGDVPYEDGGTIMSYCHLVPGVGVNLLNGFGQQPRDLMMNFINSRTCLEPLSLDEIAFVDFSYYPNPSTGLVTITSGTNIEGISVYNVAGQLLISKKVNASETTIDLSSFASGIYFVKAVNGAKEVNFRIVKQD
ncbi:zinc-dependent metalloprotease [Flavobacterium cerinum]|uniref:T9SS type A sorting domain-containing protein n=1 Tax=Flavobacterium cerinum TaxID=2502784 RepID=A0A444H9M1_9FLAO|nr:zinc-dependent metalloprotease [Flavobacterium cerinum]RWW99958.1 T9SS type A sorting domain-containing protein [Flavobacterium cerinum]